MNKYTIQIGTCTEENKIEGIYVLHPELIDREYHKLKAEVTNPKVTDESIEKIAKNIVYGKVVQRLGEYEELFEILKKIWKNTTHFKLVARNNFDEQETSYYLVIDNCEYEITQIEFDLIKEWLEK